MNKGIIFTFGLAIGAVAGSVVTCKLVKEKYEQLAREEIEEVRAYYVERQSDPVDGSTEPVEEDSVEPTKSEVFTEYSSISSLYTTENEGGDKPVSRCEPYVISPSEFGENDSYETMTLFYYNDGILADPDNNVIEDIESCIGYESLNHFGEYNDGDDSVYVRNDDTMTDYEVLLDERNYADLEGVD